jgi:CDP-diacylglycerol--glycerol-3-phosphate 3-phosphatidyltransferase
VLCFAALAGSVLVSYIRAHALARGLDLRDGLFTRAERVLVLGGGLIIHQVRIALWILAVLANATAVQRLFGAWTGFRRQETETKREDS